MPKNRLSLGRTAASYWRWLAAGLLVGALLGMTLIMLLAVGDLGPSEEGAEPDLRQQIAEGGRLILDGNTDAAIELFQALIKKYPADPEAYNNLAALYAQRGELEPARLTLEQALLTDTTYATIYQNLGLVYAELARESYGKALRLDAPPPVANLQLLARGATAPIPPPPRSLPDAPRTETATTIPPPREIAVVSPAVRPPAQASAIPPPTPTVATTTQTPAPVKEKPKPPGIDDEVRQALLLWAQAWSAQEVAAYLASYSSRFQPEGNLTRRDWEEQRRQRLLQPRWIEVELKNFRFLSQNGQGVQVELLQEYRSSHFQGRTRKRLDLIRENGRWRIAAEQSL